MKTEAIVGAFVIACATIFLATVYHVSNAQIKGARTPYRTYLRYAGGLEGERTSCLAVSRWVR